MLKPNLMPGACAGRPARAGRRYGAAGFSMIEVLVAILVLSVGLLGMAALMTASMRNAQSGNFRTQAANYALEITDILRANWANAMRYHSPTFSNPATLCASPTWAPTAYPNNDRVHEVELQRWQQALCYQLPGGSGRVQVLPGTHTEGLLTGSTFDAYNVIVDVCWTDDRTQAGSDATPAQCAAVMAGANPNECLWTGGYATADYQARQQSWSSGRITVIRLCTSI